METVQNIKPEDQRKRLNKLYRFQRHFYDLTRRFLLFGRDELLEKMNVQPNEKVLEVGCGTGRNLLKLSQIAPQAKLYGLDAADEMLKTASAKFDAQDKQKEIVLRQAFAEQFSFRETFAHDEPFDKIFISYSLSMFPKWQEAITNSLENLKADGDLYLIDFWDGKGMPSWLIHLRTWWLSIFKVYYRPEFIEFLSRLEKNNFGSLSVVSVGKNYAFIAHFQKRDE